jgi:hypothetical protein
MVCGTFCCPKRPPAIDVLIFLKYLVDMIGASVLVCGCLNNSMFTVRDIKSMLDFGSNITSFFLISGALLIYFSETPKGGHMKKTKGK